LRRNMSESMAKIKQIKLFFRIILNNFANPRVREMPKSANLGFGSLRTFCKKQVNCVQIVSKYGLCHISATKVRTLPPVLRTHFTPMRSLANLGFGAYYSSIPTLIAQFLSFANFQKYFLSSA
jgi:hypothetical protein